MELNEQFNRAMAAMNEGSQNVFITGKAGTGKTTLLSYFIEHTEKEIAVLAPTGVAALNVNGETIHSFFKFKPNITIEEAKKKAKTQGKSEMYTKLKTIVIDEISMVRADLLDCVDTFLRVARKNERAFGGVQMIFIGDLYQLPPVVSTHEREHFAQLYKSPWFFDAHVFADKHCPLVFIELEKIYRQKDPNFINLLNAIRTNTVEDTHIKEINERFTRTENRDAICLTSTNARALEINMQRLSEITSPLHTYTGSVDGGFDTKQLPTEMALELKKGAQVMFVNNDTAGRWVNGTLGTVVDIDTDILLVRTHDGQVVEVEEHTWDLYRYFYDKKKLSLGQEEIGSFSQVPLRLAWAITIHKSQGKTFDRVVIDLDRGSFASGQTYVALSRCRTFEGITLHKPIKASDIRLDWRVQRFLTDYQYALSEEAMPLEKKIKLIQHAIDMENEIEILYLKAKDVKSRRRIKPQAVGQMDYNGKEFLGLEAWCCLREEIRAFRVDRILEIRTDLAVS